MINVTRRVSDRVTIIMVLLEQTMDKDEASLTIRACSAPKIKVYVSSARCLCHSLFPFSPLFVPLRPLLWLFDLHFPRSSPLGCFIFRSLSSLLSMIPSLPSIVTPLSRPFSFPPVIPSPSSAVPHQPSPHLSPHPARSPWRPSSPSLPFTLPFLPLSFSLSLSPFPFPPSSPLLLTLSFLPSSRTLLCYSLRTVSSHVTPPLSDASDHFSLWHRSQTTGASGRHGHDAKVGETGTHVLSMHNAGRAADKFHGIASAQSAAAPDGGGSSTTKLDSIVVMGGNKIFQHVALIDIDTNDSPEEREGRQNRARRTSGREHEEMKEDDSGSYSCISVYLHMSCNFETTASRTERSDH